MISIQEDRSSTSLFNVLLSWMRLWKSTEKGGMSGLEDRAEDESIIQLERNMVRIFPTDRRQMKLRAPLLTVRDRH
jgi:hypothetical protein